jgi:hypothetical protein
LAEWWGQVFVASALREHPELAAAAKAAAATPRFRLRDVLKRAAAAAALLKGSSPRASLKMPLDEAPGSEDELGDDDGDGDDGDDDDDGDDGNNGEADALGEADGVRGDDDEATTLAMQKDPLTYLMHRMSVMACRKGDDRRTVTSTVPFS